MSYDTIAGKHFPGSSVAGSGTELAKNGSVLNILVAHPSPARAPGDARFAPSGFAK